MLVLTVHIGEEAVQFDKETFEPTPPNFNRQNITTRLQRCHLCKETGHKVHNCPNLRFDKQGNTFPDDIFNKRHWSQGPDIADVRP